MADRHTIDRLDATGENVVEEIAGVGDYLVALAAYKAAVKRWPKDKITLRNRARIIEKTWGGLEQADAVNHVPSMLTARQY